MYRRTFCPGRRNVAARCLQLVSMPWNVHLVMDITFLRPVDFVHDEWAVVYVGSADNLALLRTSSGSISWYRVGSTHGGNPHDMPGDATPHRRSAPGKCCEPT